MMASPASPADPLILLRMLQLASPGLPVGAYAYSQGLEWAVAAGWVTDEATLGTWVDEQIDGSFGRTDLPVLVRLHAAAARGDDAAARHWCRRLLAMRETRELLADDLDRGRALGRLLRDLGVPAAAAALRERDAPYAWLLAIAGVAWQVPVRELLLACAWSWLESQVIAGVKLVPLGQVAGQRLLLQRAPRLPAAVDAALACSDDDIGGTLPRLALASCLHETQYTRLFRS